MKRQHQKLSRRDFLKGVGALTAASAATAATGCAPASTGVGERAIAPTPVPLPLQYPEVPYTPTHPPNPSLLRVFTPHEATTVESLTARLLPGDPSDPGAREAGVVTYIDNLLAFSEGYAQPTYRQPPFAQVADGSKEPMLPEQAAMPSDSSDSQSGRSDQGGGQSQSGQGAPAAQAAPGGHQAILVPADLIDRYGPQTILSPRETYRLGLAALDRYTTQRFGKDFVDLDEQQQDQVVGAMADGSIHDFDRSLRAENFFGVLMQHTAEGMFCDPVYGGNRDMVGWKLVGYPGAQRAYDPSELMREGTSRRPQSIMQLHPSSPGQHANEQVILPVSGSQPDHKQPPAPANERDPLQP